MWFFEPFKAQNWHPLIHRSSYTVGYAVFRYAVWFFMIWVNGVTRIYWSTWDNSASRHFMTFRHEPFEPFTSFTVSPFGLRVLWRLSRLALVGLLGPSCSHVMSDSLVMPCACYMTALCVFKSHLDLISKVIPVNTYCKNLPASETINSFSGSLVIVTSAKFRVKFKRRQHVWKENQTMFISKKYVRNYDGCVIPLVGGSRCEVDP
jgi:hypothetical protein